LAFPPHEKCQYLLYFEDHSNPEKDVQILGQTGDEQFKFQETNFETWHSKIKQKLPSKNLKFNPLFNIHKKVRHNWIWQKI
jgi:hypothetical protein